MSKFASTRRLEAGCVLLAVTLGLSGCTSVDQTLGLSEADLALGVADVPSADIPVADVDATAETVAEEAVAEAAKEQVAEPATQNAQLATPTPKVDVGSQTAGSDATQAVELPAAVATAPTPVAVAANDAARERALDRAAKRPKGLLTGFSALAKADSGPRRATRRRVAVIKPRPKGGLPGVRSRASIFGIGKMDNEDGAIRVASAAGLARGVGAFIKQTPSVETACFKPELVAALQTVERKFGQKVVVTSGYRSPKRNRRAGGAKGSKHMTCEAADIQVPGVTKGRLAAFLRSLPNRGGVGTYCHTKSVHYDVGEKRDWSWGCRRR